MGIQREDLLSEKRGLRLEMQIVPCSPEGFVKGLKLQALNEANFIFSSALMGLENPEELPQQPQFFLNHFFFLQSWNFKLHFVNHDVTSTTTMREKSSTTN